MMCWRWDMRWWFNVQYTYIASYKEKVKIIVTNFLVTDQQLLWNKSCVPIALWLWTDERWNERRIGKSALFKTIDAENVWKCVLLRKSFARIGQRWKNEMTKEWIQLSYGNVHCFLLFISNKDVIRGFRCKNN